VGGNCMNKISFSLLVLVVVFGLGVLLVNREYAPGVSLSETSTPPIVAHKVEKPIQLFFVGDVMLGRYVGQTMDKEGYDYPYQKLGDMLKGYDLVVANLEGPVLEKYNYSPESQFQFSFSPKSLVELNKTGFNLVSLGNNHGVDYGNAGAEETRQHLAKTGIAFAGHPVRMSTSTSVVRRTVHERTISFISLNATFPSFDEQGATSLVESERSDNPNNFLILAIHWGEEYKLVANATQERLARAFVDAGADLIIGHHPHVVQNVEVYKGKAIFYSLGNFIFDQWFSKDVREQLGIKLILTANSTRFNLVPFYRARMQPVPMVDEQRQQFLDALADRSSPELAPHIKAGVVSPVFTSWR